MKYLPFNQESKRELACFWRLPYVLSGFGRVLLAREPGVTHRSWDVSLWPGDDNRCVRKLNAPYATFVRAIKQ